MSAQAHMFAVRAMESLGDIEIPPSLSRLIDQHHRNLTSLASALLRGGLGEDQVRQTVERVFQGFKAELTAAIVSIKEDGDDI